MLSHTRGHITPGETLTLRDREGRMAEALVLIAKLPAGILPSSLSKTYRSMISSNVTAAFPFRLTFAMARWWTTTSSVIKTVYAREAGSVAAPTAGLHFTDDLLARIQERGVVRAPVCLHVGLGTFRPVQSQDINQHVMHSERGEISEAVAKRLVLVA